MEADDGDDARGIDAGQVQGTETPEAEANDADLWKESDRRR